MYCSSCGSKIADTANFCNYCGNQIIQTNSNNKENKQIIDYEETKQSIPMQTVTASPVNTNSSLIGYSNKINDPAFAKYIKNSNRYAGIFGVFLALAAVIGFTIAGEVSNDLENPEALLYGCIIGGMFLLITFFSILGKKRSKTWDGIVIDKKIEKKQRKVNSNSEDAYTETYMLYTVLIRSDEGKKHEIHVENDDTLYNYYHINDKVRHHKGLNSYEKYDKSKDTVIFCNACATRHSIQEEYCRRCKCPLLK